MDVVKKATLGEFVYTISKLNPNEVIEHNKKNKGKGKTKYKYYVKIYLREFNKVVVEYPTTEKLDFYHLYDIKKILGLIKDI